MEESKAKADLFAVTFDAKSQLPPEVVDTPFFGRPGEEFEGFIALRTRAAARLFKTLDEAKACGSDRIPAKILKMLWRE